MNNQSYMTLPYDLSGSMAKNRFKNEILWGMHKIFEIYIKEENFNIIFDYVCDIEVHWENEKYEFYQIKTSNSGEAYTQNKLINKGKKENSVLAKLYILKRDFEGDKNKINLAIVSNKPFKDKKNKLYNNIEKLEFNMLDDDIKLDIEKSLKKEIKINNVEFNNISFIYTTMDLLNPKNSLTGELVNFFNEILKVQIKKPAVLYSVLVDKISEKAEYEMKSKTYEELVKNKGISKDNIKELFNKHMEISNNSVEKAKQNIERIYETNYNERVNMIVALSSIVQKLNISKKLKELESEIIKSINQDTNILENNLENIVNILYEKYKNKFDIEYSKDEIKSFIILILMKREEEMYE